MGCGGEDGRDVVGRRGGMWWGGGEGCSGEEERDVVGRRGGM